MDFPGDIAVFPYVVDLREGTGEGIVLERFDAHREDMFIEYGVGQESIIRPQFIERPKKPA